MKICHYKSSLQACSRSLWQEQRKKRKKLAETVFCVRRQSRPVSLRQGNELDWICGILFIRYFFSWLADFLWVMQMPVRYNKNILLCHGSNRVRAGPGKPGKSSKFIMAFSRTGKSWKKSHWSWNVLEICLTWLKNKKCMESSKEN